MILEQHVVLFYWSDYFVIALKLSVKKYFQELNAEFLVKMKIESLGS